MMLRQAMKSRLRISPAHAPSLRAQRLHAALSPESPRPSATAFTNEVPERPSEEKASCPNLRVWTPVAIGKRIHRAAARQFRNQRIRRSRTWLHERGGGLCSACCCHLIVDAATWRKHAAAAGLPSNAWPASAGCKSLLRVPTGVRCGAVLLAFALVGVQTGVRRVACTALDVCGVLTLSPPCNLPLCKKCAGRVGVRCEPFPSSDSDVSLRQNGA
eukprot:977908-Pleurochrysis_carterae.AAC.2